jgi:hypothetical protein
MNRFNILYCLFFFVFSIHVSAQSDSGLDTLKLETLVSDTTQTKFKNILFNKDKILNSSLSDVLLESNFEITKDDEQLTKNEKDSLQIEIKKELISSISEFSFNYKKKGKSNKNNNSAYFNTVLLKELIDRYSVISIGKNNTATIDVAKLRFKQEYKVGKSNIVWGLTPQKIFVKIALGKYSGKTLYEIVNKTEKDSLEQEVTNYLNQL